MTMKGVVARGQFIIDTWDVVEDYEVLTPPVDWKGLGDLEDRYGV